MAARAVQVAERAGGLQVPLQGQGAPPARALQGLHLNKWKVGKAEMPEDWASAWLAAVCSQSTCRQNQIGMRRWGR